MTKEQVVPGPGFAIPCNRKKKKDFFFLISIFILFVCHSYSSEINEEKIMK